MFGTAYRCNRNVESTPADEREKSHPTFIHLAAEKWPLGSFDALLTDGAIYGLLGVFDLHIAVIYAFVLRKLTGLKEKEAHSR